MVKICRILMANKKFINKTSKEEMKIFLDQLEKSCGGHGNGIAFVTKGEVVFTYKDVKLTNQDIVDMLYHKKTKTPDWFFYHTRVASAGSIRSENCHPYVNDENDFMIQMNGTERDFGLIGKDRDITDTQVIFEIYNKTGYDISSLRLLSPRFMGLSKGKVFATNPSSSPLKYYESEGAFAIASEFEPKRENVKTMKKSYVWLEGEEMKEEPVVTYNNHYGSYKGSTSGYSAYNGYYYDYINKKWSKEEENCEACTIQEEIYDVEDYNNGFISDGSEIGKLNEIELELEDYELNSLSGFSSASIGEDSFLLRLEVLESICFYYLPSEYYAEEIIKHFFTKSLKVNTKDGKTIEYKLTSSNGLIILKSSLEIVKVDKYGLLSIQNDNN